MEDEFLEAFRDLFAQCSREEAKPTDGYAVWLGPIEDVPQDWMDATIEYLDN